MTPATGSTQRLLSGSDARTCSASGLVRHSGERLNAVAIELGMGMLVVYQVAQPASEIGVAGSGGEEGRDAEAGSAVEVAIGGCRRVVLVEPA